MKDTRDQESSVTQEFSDSRIHSLTSATHQFSTGKNAMTGFVTWALCHRIREVFITTDVPDTVVLTTYSGMTDPME